MDLSDEWDRYQLVVDVPGATKDQLEIRPGPLPGTLLVKVQGKEEKTPQSVLRSERGVRGPVRYERVVPVAWDADVARAQPTIEDGVLRISVPKQGSDKRPEKKGEKA